MRIQPKQRSLLEGDSTTESALFEFEKVSGHPESLARKLWSKTFEERFVLTAFLVPLIIRAIPEILVGPYPIGWDIITYYIPNSIDMASGNMSVWGVIASPPVLYLVVVPSYLLTRISLVLTFKVLGPIIYRFLCRSIFS